MTASLLDDTPFIPGSRALHPAGDLSCDLPRGTTTDLQGRFEVPAVVIRAPRQTLRSWAAPVAMPSLPPPPPPGMARPLARIDLRPALAADLRVVTPRRPQTSIDLRSAAKPATAPTISEPEAIEPAAPAPRQAAPRKASSSKAAPRKAASRKAASEPEKYESSPAARFVFGIVEAIVGAAATTFALVTYAEASIVSIFGGKFGGAAVSLAVAVFAACALAFICGIINLIWLRLSERPAMAVGTVLAFMLAPVFFTPVQDGLTVFGYYIQGGRGVHPKVLEYQNPAAFRRDGL